MVQSFANGRIVVDPSRPARRGRPFQALFLGHAPSARLAGSDEAFRGRPTDAMLDALERVGLAEHARWWRTWREDRDSGWQGARRERFNLDFDDPLERARCFEMHHLPLFLRSAAEFRELFPDAAMQRTELGSELASARAWLPSAVEDFFTAGGRELWVVVTPEVVQFERPSRAAAIDALLPSGRRASELMLGPVAALTGVELVLALEQVGLVALPDLERLQLPVGLPLRAPSDVDPAVPDFRPCGTQPAPPAEAPEADVLEPMPRFADLATRIANFLGAARPDVQCLITAPLLWAELQQAAGIHEPALAELREQLSHGDGPFETRRRSLVVLHPYLSSGPRALRSPTGLVAGAIAASALARGAWRSIAGRTLPTESRVEPPIDAGRAADLRERFDVSVLLDQSNGVALDDERSSSELFAHSAEVVRFFGWLRRELERFGESMVFDVDPRDPRPRIALEQFLDRLVEVGALDASRGSAYDLATRSTAEGTVVFELALRPAYPIDRIRLSLVCERQTWRVEESRG